MAVRRTKKHKQEQAEKQVTTYSLSLPKTSTTSAKSVQVAAVAKKSNTQDMFDYSLDFIKQDLLRTIVVATIVVFVLVVVVYFDLR
jgi:hypothetical protein